jgi:hypothetical protein
MPKFRIPLGSSLFQLLNCFVDSLHQSAHIQRLPEHRAFRRAATCLPSMLKELREPVPVAMRMGSIAPRIRKLSDSPRKAVWNDGQSGSQCSPGSLLRCAVGCKKRLDEREAPRKCAEQAHDPEQNTYSRCRGRCRLDGLRVRLLRHAAAALGKFVTAVAS